MLKTYANTYEVLQKSAEIHSDKIAIQFLPDPIAAQVVISFTYQQLFNSVNKMARWLQEQGTKNDSVISSVLPNIPETYYLHWAAEAVAVNHPLAAGMPMDTTVDLILEAKSSLVILPPSEQYPPTTAIIKQLESQKFKGKIFTLDQIEYQNLNSDSIDSTKQPNDLCSIFHTSATTQRAKQMQFTHKNRLIMLEMLSERFNFDSTDKFLIGFPLFHISCVLYNHLALAKGAELIVMGPTGWLNPQLPAKVWDLVEKFKITHFGALPFVFNALATPGNEQIKSLKSVLSGMPLEDGLFKKLTEQLLKVTIYNIYGLTESGALVSTRTNCEGKQLGEIVAGQVVKLFKFENGNCLGEAVKPSELGTICISGDNIGFYLDSENHKNLMWNNYLKTNDMAVINSNNQIEFFCRQQDLYFKNDKPASCFDIDLLLATHPDINKVGVIPNKNLTKAIAFVELKSNKFLDIMQLKEWFYENKYSAEFLPDEIVIKKNILVNGMGKVIKPLLAVLLEDEHEKIVRKEPVEKLTNNFF